MAKIIIANTCKNLYFEGDRVLTDNKSDAKIFTDKKEALLKSMELHENGLPVCWMFIE